MKKVAKAFGMSVKEFAEYIGYSRQAMYNEDCYRNTIRWKATLQLLRMKSAQQLAEDKKIAERKFRDRENALAELENKLLQGGADHE